MSHEIRTPLVSCGCRCASWCSRFCIILAHALLGLLFFLQNCIVGISSLMDNSDLSPQHRDNVKMIVSSGKLLRHIVDDVLDYSKLESGAMEVDIKEANLEEILIDSVNAMASSAVTKKRDIAIKTFYDANLLPELTTDSRRLQQILYNLLSNACKFSREGGSVEVSAKLVEVDTTPDPEVEMPAWSDNAKTLLRLCVKDYGKGIEKKEFENIFHPFTQTKSGISNTEGGTGLGLSITRKLVQGLGGSIPPAKPVTAPHPAGIQTAAINGALLIRFCPALGP